MIRLLLFLFGSVATTISASSDVADASGAALLQNLRVCVVIESAFTMLRPGIVSVADVTSDDQLRGFDVELRRIILANTNYTVTVIGSYGELNVRLRTGPSSGCDIGWAAFFQVAKRDRCNVGANTCRAMDADVTNALATGTSPPVGWGPYRCCIDFSFAHLSMSIGVMNVKVERGFAELLMYMIVAEAFVANFASLLFIMSLGFGMVVWIFEQRKNTGMFPRNLLDATDEAVWWAVVTVTTVGYGDRVPTSLGGRMVAMVWMLLGLFLVSLFTGHMSSRFGELQQLGVVESITDLAGQRVCSYQGNFNAWYFPSYIEIVPIEADNVEQCGRLMEQGLVDAVVMEKSFLNYWSRNDAWALHNHVKISRDIGATPIGLMFAESSEAQALNNEISLRLKEATDTKAFWSLQSEWFSGAKMQSHSFEDSVQWSLVIPALVMLGVYLTLQAVGAAFPTQTRKLRDKVAQEATMKQQSARRSIDKGVTSIEMWTGVDINRDGLIGAPSPSSSSVAATKLAAKQVELVVEAAAPESRVLSPQHD